MKLAFLVIFLVLFSVKSAYSLEIVGFSKDKLNGNHVFLKYSTNSKKQDLFSVGDQLPRGYRLIEINDECIKIKKNNEIITKCMPINKEIIDEHFSLVARNINAKVILKQISDTLEIPVILDKSVSEIHFEKVEIYNIHKSELLSVIKELFEPTGYKSTIIKDILIVSTNRYLQNTNENIYQSIEFNLATPDKKFRVDFVEGGPVDGFFLMFSSLINIKISHETNKHGSVGIIMRKPERLEDIVNVFLISTRLMGYTIKKNNSEYFAEKNI